MFSPQLLLMLENHRTRWTPLKAGMKLRSKLGLQYEIWRVMGGRSNFEAYRGEEVQIREKANLVQGHTETRKGKVGD